METVEINSILAGAIDAGDYATAASALLALEASTKLPRKSVRLFAQIAFETRSPTRADARKIEAAAKVIGGVQ